MPPVGAAASRLVCAGCGADVSHDPLPFRCPSARPGDDIDHVVRRMLDPAAVTFPHGDERNPFVRFRRLFHSYHLGAGRGMSDAQFVDIVSTLDTAVARTDGRGFSVTAFEPMSGLTTCLEPWVKDETRNVSGSHKARHLMGILIYLEVLEALGDTSARGRPLAIASCGNAALAAAVIARAGARALHVFIPPDAPGAVVARLNELGAKTVVCRREPSVAGDPCYLRFGAAVKGGAIPFCCQGSANGMTIEGGETLGWEMIAPERTFDAIVIQVGGGALASAVMQAFEDAQALGACDRRPRFYAVQTRGAYPLKRAYDRVLERAGGAGSDLAETLRFAAAHRHDFMWPWEDEPRSIARGILDDETYDWLAVVKGMIDSGGRPIVVEEQELADAYAVAHRATRIDVDHTGAAGLAGLIRLVREGEISADEQVAVVFSGVER